MAALASCDTDAQFAPSLDRAVGLQVLNAPRRGGGQIVVDVLDGAHACLRGAGPDTVGRQTAH